MNTGGRLLGCRVIISDAGTPKLKLSKNVQVSDSFREEFDCWLLSMFGKNYTIRDGEVLNFPEQNIIIVNPRTLKTIRQGLDNNQDAHYSVIDCETDKEK